jgi:hypothetical protein
MAATVEESTPPDMATAIVWAGIRLSMIIDERDARLILGQLSSNLQPIQHA